MRVAVIDDSLEDMKMMQDTLLSHDDIESSYFQSAVAFLKEEMQYEVLFIDIDMPEVNGLAFAQQVRNLHKKVIINFISWHHEYVFESFKIHPFQYVRKDYLKEDMDICIEELHKYLQNKNAFLKYCKKGHLLQIPVSSILYVEKYRMKSKIFFTDGTDEALYISLSSIQLQNLPDFHLVNQSVLVNFQYVEHMNNDYSFTLINGDKIEISRRKRSDILLAYNQYKAR